MGRPSNPLTPYFVRIHSCRGYKYAFVWRTKTDEKGVNKRYQFIIGSIGDNNRVSPNATFRLLDVEERRKFRFPKELDTSEIDLLNGDGFKPVEPPRITFEEDVSPGEDNSDNLSSSEEEVDTTNQSDEEEPFKDIYAVYDKRSFTSEEAQYNNRLYGHVWLLEQLAKKKGVYEDLLTAFNNDFGKVTDILSLAIYRIVDSRSFNRYSRWQQTHKILSGRNIYSGYITKFTQTITENHRMLFIQCRLNRQPKDALLSCDSTTRSGYGKCLVDVRWGHNKDDSELKCSVEASVYSLTTFEPIYYRRFSGETSDMITVVTIIRELVGLGLKIEDIIFMTDRGYCSQDNMGRYVNNNCSFITCAKVNQEPVMGALLKVKYDAYGCPENMEYNSDLKMYCGQFAANDFVVLLDDNTEFNVSGVKVNLYCNPKDRAAELAELRNEIKIEKAYEQTLRKDKSTHLSLEDLRQKMKYYQITVERENKKKKKKSEEITGEKTSNVNGDERKTVATDDVLFLQFGEQKYRVLFNEEKAQKEYAKCGFFASCMYKMDLSAEEAYTTYVSRDGQEKSFFELKDDIDADKQECSSEEGQIGRLFIFFVANILVSSAKHVWKESLSEVYDSYYEVLDAMEPIRLVEFPDASQMTCFNTEQLQICKAFDIEVPTECLPSTAKEVLRKQLYPKKRGRKPKTAEDNSVV